MKYALAAACALIVSPACPVLAGGEADTTWHQEPFRIKSGERLLDTYDNDPGGHAAPFLADVDGDGLRDLTVGSIQGRFHFYKNIGTDAAPRFAGKSTFLMAGLSADERAQVPNFCCVASGPQLRDIDGDGVLDLTSGSYDPGALYWFKGRGNGTFHARHMLTDLSGRPVLPDPQVNPYEPVPGEYRNLMANLAWADWDNNGHPDLIIGNYPGQLFIRLNGQDVWGPSSFSSRPISSQPQFVAAKFQKNGEIRIDGGNAVPDKHAAPAVADWDGDGLWDILVGSESGRVFWLRNTGKPGEPVFKQREEILGPGATGHWVEPGKAPGRGIRAQIQAVDYNLDGKMDLLVGEWSVVQTPRADLTRRERATLQSLREELQALDRRMGFKADYLVRYKVEKYRQDKAALERAQVLEKEMTRYLTKYGSEAYPDYRAFWNFQKFTGHVWVFLRS